jgi:hypothetical protein
MRRSVWDEDAGQERPVRARANASREWIRFGCPFCGAALRARTHATGRRVRCGACRERIRVPIPWWSWLAVHKASASVLLAANLAIVGYFAWALVWTALFSLSEGGRGPLDYPDVSAMERWLSTSCMLPVGCPMVPICLAGVVLAVAALYGRDWGYYALAPESGVLVLAGAVLTLCRRQHALWGTLLALVLAAGVCVCCEAIMRVRAEMRARGGPGPQATSATP